MDPGLLDTLIKLAALGTSGVCIFAIFWIGWLILHLPDDAPPEKHKTLRMFMIVTVIIAVISGVSGFFNARYNADQIAELQQDKNVLELSVAEYRESEIETQNAAESLAAVLKSKEAANLRNPSQEIQTHINLLKTFIAKMDVES